MKNNRISISPPHYNDSVSKHVEAAFAKNEISNYGENIDTFEASLKTYLNSENEVVALNSGTSAIHLALIQLGITRGDEVLCQTFTFCGSANPIIYQGASPVFVDSELDTWNMSPNHLDNAIKDRIKKGKTPKAIIVVHLYGMPAKMEEISAIALKYNIPIIEDAAEALGSSYNNKKCGTLGDYSVISFNGNKIITTSGGGALVCKTQKQKEEAIFYAKQAKDKAEHYQHSKIGYNYRMSNISAGIGRGQMEVLENRIASRRTMHKFYSEVFKNHKDIKLMVEPNNKHISNCWLSCITFQNESPITKADFQKAMQKNNIETRPLWKPMHLQPIYKDAAYYGNNESTELFAKGLCLPSGSNLSELDKQRINASIADIL